ncbi:MAG TPA: sigma-70 family RNA polymerase sigma factor [Armatimonadetes bacterium]|nr:sigma-70 family RNA polymerase sigma factor [Armatimonadota bacterium]
MPTSDYHQVWNLTEIPDKELVARCQQGDRAAFDEIMARYESKVYNLAYRLLNNQDDAFDIAQEAFIRIYRGLSRFRGSSTLSTWIYRITLNLCLDELKRRKRRPLSETELQEDDTPEPLLERVVDENSDPNVAVESQARQAIVQWALTQLPEHHRAVIVLYDLEGLSYTEIAEVLHTNVGTVKSRLNRARAALKELLQPYRELFE